MQKKKLLDSVLTVGPNFLNHRGGIGAVIETYSRNVDNFLFIPTYESNLSRIKNLFFFIRSVGFIVWRLLTKRTIRIIHLHGASKGSFYRKYFIFFIVKVLFKRKVIYHLHGGKFHVFFQRASRLTRRMVTHMIEKSDHIICLSSYWQTYLHNTFNVFNVSPIYNPIECRPYHFDRNNNRHLTFLFLGKIGDNKGIFGLLELLTKNTKQYENSLRIVVGGDGEVERLKHFIEKHSLNNIVQYVGWVAGEQKNKLLAECDALILPSYFEGLPISILEAMSFGKAIITTTVGSIPEVVKDGQNGILIQPGDWGRLEERLNFVLENPNILSKMGKVSYNLIEQYSVAEILTKVNALYIDVLKS